MFGFPINGSLGLGAGAAGFRRQRTTPPNPATSFDEAVLANSGIGAGTHMALLREMEDSQHREMEDNQHRETEDNQHRKMEDNQHLLRTDRPPAIAKPGPVSTSNTARVSCVSGNLYCDRVYNCLDQPLLSWAASSNLAWN